VPGDSRRNRDWTSAVQQGKRKSRADQEHVAAERRHISRQHLKDWIAAQFPSDKPAFLFDDIERNTHTAINKDAYQALQAERDGLRARLEKAADEYRKLRSERDELVLSKKQNSLNRLKPAKDLGLRAETTYLNIIGGMLALFMMKSPAGKATFGFQQPSVCDRSRCSPTSRNPGIYRTDSEKNLQPPKRALTSNPNT
jgi:hypothetical protein